MAEAQPQIITEDSDSEVEYSDALDLDCDGDTLKSDELKNLDKDKHKVREKVSGVDDFFDTEDHEKSDDCEEEGEDQPVDPLKERKETEEKLTDEERESRRKEAKALKEAGNSLYLGGENTEAASKYTEGLNVCPLCFTEDRAILFANRAAVHIKTGLKESALEDCNQAIELKANYVKALLRRGQCLEDLDKPHEALKDFEKVLEIDPGLAEAKLALLRLPEKIREKDEKLKEEMLENLKKLGNMVLKPFGLSTNNFNVVQDPKTGGYSVNFNK